MRRGSVAVLAGVSPAWVKVSRQPNTKSEYGAVTRHILQRGGKHRDTMRKREGIEPRNLLKVSVVDIVHNRAGRILAIDKAREQERDGV